MLKHEKIISSLSDERKIRLLTDLRSLERQEFATLGVPKVKMAKLNDFIGKGLPRPKALTNSWDLELVYSVALERFEYMASQGYNLVELPPVKTAVNPYLPALSEDPVLSSRMLISYIDAAVAAGVMPVISGFEINDYDIEWLDSSPNYRTIYENVIRPHIEAIKTRSNIAFMAENVDNESYKIINSSILELVNENDFSDKKNYALLKNISPEETVEKISEGFICVNASFDNLMSALSRYRELKKLISIGQTTVSELENEVANSMAIAPESIDKAVDEVIEFAYRCSDVAVKTEKEEPIELLQRAFLDSAVLLKNEKSILPLVKSKKKKKICIIGNAGSKTVIDESMSELNDYNYEYVFSEGYDPSKDRDGFYFGHAENLINSSDVVLVFLEINESHERRIPKTKKLTIPANQLALCDNLKAFGHKVIAVVSSNYAPDPSFAESFAALLLVPFGVEYGFKAVTEIIFGKCEAGGRLASTMYENSDEELKKRVAYKKIVGAKIGSFTGYRYYDTEGYFSGYPFGYGLSYSKFAYSGLKVTKDTVEFTVKNIGKRSGTEVAQIYIGKEASSVLRPKKELMAFEKLVLKPGERKTVRINLELPSVYDVSSREYLAESGYYTVYVASSVSDVRLSKKIKEKGESFETDYEKKSDYLQSVSNIKSDKYTLEANCISMKRLSKNTVYGVLMLVVALALWYYSKIALLNDIFIDVVAVAIAVGAVILFIIDIFERKKHHAEACEEIDKANKEHFADAKQVPVLTADNMFISEFDVTNEKAHSEEIVVNEGEELEALKYVDKELSFEAACRELEKFAKNRGCLLDSNTVKHILASLSASRLFIVKGMSDGDFSKFVNVISEYFGTTAYVDSLNSVLTSENQLLFDRNDSGVVQKKKTLKAIEAARNEKQKMFFVGLNNVHTKNISAYFVPFARYAKNPLTGGSFSSLNEFGVTTTFTITPNVWFVLNLKSEENIAALPGYIAETATVNRVSFENSPRENDSFIVRPFYYYQMEYLSESAKKSFSFSEDDWKKIDRIEDYVNTIKEYNIGNKLWTSVESFVAAFMACGGDAEEVLDRAIATKLLPSVFSTVNKAIPEDSAGLAETLSGIFGEDNCSMCNKAIIECAPNIK